MTSGDDDILLQCIGWSGRTWAAPIRDILIRTKTLEYHNLRVLELGAGRVSTLGALFFRNSNHVTVSYYDQSAADLVAERVGFLSSKSNGVFSKRLKQISILDLNGTYDVIVMKSVLGGVFRTDQADQDINDFLEDIAARNLSDKGVLITIDNGVPFYARLLGRYGARAQHWRYFLSEEFSGATFQSCFGLFGAFSLKTRLGYIGEVLENLIHIADCTLFGIFNKHPTVIVSAYLKASKSAEQDHPE